MNTPDFKIEKGIPIPTQRRNLGPLSKAIRNLQVGESFAAPYSRSIQTGAPTLAKRAGIKITTRTATDSGVKILRVWRIK